MTRTTSPWRATAVIFARDLEGITPTGRATVQMLAMNDGRCLELRAELRAQGQLF